MCVIYGIAGLWWGKGSDTFHIYCQNRLDSLGYILVAVADSMGLTLTTLTLFVPEATEFGEIHVT